MAKIYKSADELIGRTPLLKLENIENSLNLDAKILAKLEFFNPAGSVKDRVAKKMLDEAEKSGKLTKDIVVLHETGKISLYRADSPDLHCPGVSMLPPYFVAEVQVELPWVLNEEP